ncbi:MAG: SCO family protein [Pedobacter sp.]|nr:MAG: SCO family protein [Pedobacter sp.]
MNSSLLKKILILATILSVPGFLYYLLQDQGKNRYRNLSYFGPKKLSGTFHSIRGKQIADTAFHKVEGVVLTDQNGQTFDIDKINDKVFIVNLFYTRSGFATRTANTVVEKLSKSYQKNKRIQFISISLDPLHDTPSILNAYARTLGATQKWQFLTGSKESVYKTVNKALLLDAIDTDGKIAYNNMLVLLDHKHHIRGYYEAANHEAVAKLDDEIKVLMAEELRNLKDGR